MMREDIRARLLATFAAEAREHLEAITAHLLALEREPPPPRALEIAEAVFREVHTLKGAARSVSRTDLEALCQALESVLSRITRGELGLDGPRLALLQDAAGAIGRLLAEGAGPAPAPLLDRLAAAGSAPAPRAAGTGPRPEGARPAPPGGPRPAPGDTIRLPAAAIERVSAQGEELLVPKLAGGQRLDEARALLAALGRCRALAARGGRPAGAALSAELAAAEARARELVGRMVRDQRVLAGIVDGLLLELRGVRMTPVATVLALFPAMVRDLAVELGKEAEWAVEGADLEVDRRVLEELKEPLIHLVRNAVDHGLELPAARRQAGKPARGRIAVGVRAREGGRVEVEIADDGRGVDTARVRAAAVRAGLAGEAEAAALGEEGVLALLFRSGLSTSPIISDVSGHGLGLAIVKERVERLGGEVAIASRPGAGTTVRLVVPATVVTFRGLLVQAGGEFLLPTESVERVLRVAPGRVERLEGREAVAGPGGPLAVAPLREVLELAPAAGTDGPAPRPCVVVRAGAARAGLLVDAVLGEREVLVKEFRRPLARVRHVAGAGLLGTGRVALILRPADLLRAVQRRQRPAPPRPAAPAGGKKTILVVDDSITTRTMEKNLLEAAGYAVAVAADGAEAWARLGAEAFDLVVSDVDMPRMDGFELTARVRADRRLADLPVVLVTALESREDRERGIEVGASAYVVKSSFDQSNLLELIRRLA